jgi:hypothetical protein
MNVACAAAPRGMSPKTGTSFAVVSQAFMAKASAPATVRAQSPAESFLSGRCVLGHRVRGGV